MDGSGNLAQARDHYKWLGARATHGFVGSGKVYFEGRVSDEGLARIGVAAFGATYNLGTDKASYGFGGTGKKSYASSFESYGSAFALNDVIGVGLDLDNRTLSFYKNGQDLGVAYTLAPELADVPLFPAVVLKNAEMIFDFNPASTPAGYVSAATAVGSGGPGVVDGASLAKEADPGVDVEHAPACLILEPTRELAEQVYDQIEAFSAHLASPKPRSLLAVGGSKPAAQLAALKAGVDIVIATPGRVKEFIRSGALVLGNVRFFVMDEADQLLSDGNMGLIKDIYGKLPLARIRVQIMCFSATLHTPAIRSLSHSMMQNPTWVDLKGHDLLPPTVHHAVVHVDPSVRRVDRSLPAFKGDRIHKKDPVRPGAGTPESASQSIKLLKIQILVEIIDAYKMDQAIIFCRTRVDCDAVVDYLNALPTTGAASSSGGNAKSTVSKYKSLGLHSGKASRRAANLDAFKDGEVRFLVCTDVAARGIDVAGLPYVINYTLPDEAAQYVHRVGRVGRADALGLAISLVGTVPEKVWFHTCKKAAKCSNTTLVASGGCAIWYNEPELLAQIEDHIAESIPELNAQYKLEGVESSAYGSKVDLSSNNQTSAKWVMALKPTVQSLAALESSAQISFLTLPGDFQRT